MEELTIRGARAQRNLMEWSRRVADCRSSGMSVKRWCTGHNVKPKTYYNQQKKVFAAMLAQQQAEMSEASSKRYGCRRKHCSLKNEGIVIFEKVVRIIMQEESMVVPFVRLEYT